MKISNNYHFGIYGQGDRNRTKVLPGVLVQVPRSYWNKVPLNRKATKGKGAHNNKILLPLLCIQKFPYLVPAVFTY